MRRILLASALLLGGLGVAPFSAQAGSLEDLLVQKGVITRADAESVTDSGIPAKVYYKNGIKLEFPEAGATFGLNAFIQTRYTFTDADTGSNTSSFDLKRARLIAAGSVLNKEFDYYLQTEFAGSEATLKDAFVRWNPLSSTAIRAGQYKIEVSRQFNTSDYALQFADRSAASEYFDLDRNQGAELVYGPCDKAKIGLAIFNGVSTGEGNNKTGVDTNHTGVIFARADLVGKMDALKEGDVENTESLAVNVGAAYAYSDFNKDSGDPVASINHTGQTVSVDANVKDRGFSLHTEFFWAEDEPEGADSAQPLGGYVQTGFFLTPKQLEVAVRYSVISCDDGKAGGDCAGLDKIQEATAGLNYYFMGHNLKAQLNYVYKNEDPAAGDAGSTKENRIMAQLSAYL